MPIEIILYFVRKISAGLILRTRLIHAAPNGACALTFGTVYNHVVSTGLADFAHRR